MNTEKLRRALPEDAQKVADLLNSAYRGEGSKAGWTTEADIVGGERTNAEAVRDLIEEFGSHFLVVADPEILGCIHIKEEDGGTVYVGMLAVKPNLQSRGIGKKLLLESVRYAEVTGKQRVRMTAINVRTQLIDFYNRLGFFPSGKREPFPHQDLLKVQGVELVELVKSISTDQIVG